MFSFGRGVPIPCSRLLLRTFFKSLNTTLEPDGSKNPAESNVLTEQELNRCFEDGFDITGSG